MRCKLEVREVKGDSGEVSNENEEHIIENRRKVQGTFYGKCYEVAKNCADLSSGVLWEVLLGVMKLGFS